MAALDNLIPALYLKGVSMAQMVSALQPILGEKAAGLSPTNIQRLLGQWQNDHRQWERRNLSDRQYVYLWADGIYFSVRLTFDRPCLLVLVGARADGSKELVAVGDGQRESKLSWQELLRDLKNRGLSHAPKVAIGDGALGFWAALDEEYPQTRGQRCWVHKTANVLDKLPKSVQPSAKSGLHEIYPAPTRKAANQAWKDFMELYEKKYPKAWPRIRKHCSRSTTFRPNIGPTCGRPSPSKAPSPACDIAPVRPKAMVVAKRPWRWSFNSYARLKASGENSTAPSNWTRSSPE